MNLFNYQEDIHGDDAVELTEKLQNLKKEVETLYARWEELEEIKAESEE